MPRSKDAKSYSPEYGKTLERAYLEGEVFVPVSDWKIGKRLQSEFYSFIQAVKRHPDEHFQWLQYCHQVAISLTGSSKEQGPQTLRFYNKENSESAQILRAALGLSKSSDDAKASEEAFLQKMMAPDSPIAAVNPMDKPFDYGQSGSGEEQAPGKPMPAGNRYYTRKDRK